MLRQPVITCGLVWTPPQKKKGYPPANFFAIWSTSMRFGRDLDMVGGLFVLYVAEISALQTPENALSKTFWNRFSTFLNFPPQK